MTRPPGPPPPPGPPEHFADQIDRAREQDMESRAREDLKSRLRELQIATSIESLLQTVEAMDEHQKLRLRRVLGVDRIPRMG
jgi:hypothetical protein